MDFGLLPKMMSPKQCRSLLMEQHHFFFGDMSTQEKGEGGFKLVTSASLGIVHSRLMMETPYDGHC
jgi:hypothetical protein